MSAPLGDSHPHEPGRADLSTLRSSSATEDGPVGPAARQHRPTGDKIIIIGGGVAGLACGCYLQMNGYRTEILEMNPVPGGLCTAWDRGPYVFDGCLSWLVGTHPSSTFHQVWSELGVFAGREIIHRDEFLRVEGRDGQVLSLSTDLDRLVENCKRIAPEDADRIAKLLRAVRRCNLHQSAIGKPD